MRLASKPCGWARGARAAAAVACALAAASGRAVAGPPSAATATPSSAATATPSSEPDAQKQGHALAKPDAGQPGAAKPDAAEPATPQQYVFHAQGTFTTQYHPTFPSPYRGRQSLDPGSRAEETLDLTAYAGVAPWRGAELWFNPEIDQGFGLSNTLGIDGFTSAEAYKVGRNYPYVRIQRLFLRQTFGLGGGSEKVDPDLNQLGGTRDKDRLVLTIGKLGVVDVFDTNKYAHDSRNDFLNWSILDTGSFDYAADAWGYTYGAAAEWYVGDWTLRGGVFDLSGVPNNENLDKTLHQYQLDAELERRWSVRGLAGAIRVTGFVTRGRMARLRDAVDLALRTGSSADGALVRHYATRPGLSVNLEQQLAADMGLFVRAGFADPKYEGYEFTDIDRTLASGLSLTGARWGRSNDTVAVAGVLNAIGKPARDYLADGGLGILAGDGRLPHPGSERIVEAYYSLSLLSFARLTADYQYVVNPAFNRDRGPVQVFGLRLHLQK